VPDAFLIFAGFMVFGIGVYFVRKRQMGVAPSLVTLEDQGDILKHEL